MTTERIHLMSASETNAAVVNGDVSPVEVVQAYLDRIDRFDSGLNAYITVCSEEALAAAGHQERQLDDGTASGPLFGVPIAGQGPILDRGHSHHQRFTGLQGLRALGRRHGHLQAAGRRGDIARKIEPERELAMGGTQDPPWGIPRNPWDLERTPGESSAGSGVALSAHLCAASVGEDTGGSGRGPASYCGVVGLRPTFTRVSRYGMTPMCWFMDAAAPMTKTVRDCALVLRAIAGFDPKDPFTSDLPVPDYAASLESGVGGLRVGIIRELHESEDVHPEVRSAIEASLEEFRQLGATVQEVSIPLISLAGAIFVGIADTEGAGARDDILRTRPGELDPATRTRLQSASLVPAKIYNRAARARVLLRRQFMEALENVDLLVSATAPYPAPRHTDLTASFQSAEDVRARFFFRRGLHRLLCPDRAASHFHSWRVHFR